MNRLTLALIATIACSLPASAMTLDDVFELLQVGISEEVILEQFEADGDPIRLETDDIIALKRAGASDDLLRTLIGSAADHRIEAQSSRRENWTDGYSLPERASGLRVEIGYDPFGYHWVSNPYYYTYYYPFRSVDFGFYYAGWFHRSWWGWHSHRARYFRGYCNSLYWNHHHHHYYHPHDTAHYDKRYRSGRHWNSRDRDDRSRVERTRERTRSGVTRSQVERSRNPARLDRSRRSDETRRSEGIDRSSRNPSRDRVTTRSDRKRSTVDRDRSRTRTPRVEPRTRSNAPRVSEAPSRSSRSSANRSRSGSSSRSRSERSRSR